MEQPAGTHRHGFSGTHKGRNRADAASSARGSQTGLAFVCGAPPTARTVPGTPCRGRHSHFDPLPGASPSFRRLCGCRIRSGIFSDCRRTEPDGAQPAHGTAPDEGTGSPGGRTNQSGCCRSGWGGGLIQDRFVSEHKKSYGQLLKSSALIGSSSAFGLGFGIVRNKAMALILGPSGFGLAGDFNSIVDMIRTLAGMGISNSGVRQIAEAVGSGDEQRVARTIRTLRRVALCSGTLGALLLLLFCFPLAKLTFGKEIDVKGVVFDTRAQVSAIALLALAVLFADISAAQSALVQGMRRIADLAKINVLGALYGTVLSIPIVYVWGARGVVPSLICVAGMGILTSWWYARKIKVPPVPVAPGEFLSESRELLRMGVVFMS